MATQAMDIITKPGCRRTMGKNMTMGSNLCLDVTMALVEVMATQISMTLAAARP